MPVTREDLTFTVDGSPVAAWLWRPAGARTVVVMAHGMSATREQALPRVAEAFAEAGLAVLLFDWRGFGASGGPHRQVLDVARQLEDLRAAVEVARGFADRVVLWGTSFSGGHVLTVAADDPSIAAVIAQVPFTDGRVRAGNLSKPVFARLLARAVRDRVGASLGRPPVTVPVIGPPGSLALLTSPDVVSGFEALDPPGSSWRNELAARVVFEVPRYRPVEVADRLQMPVLFCVSARDSTVPSAPARRAASLAPRGELVVYDVDHFAIYAPGALERALGDQLGFLRRHSLVA